MHNFLLYRIDMQTILFFLRKKKQHRKKRFQKNECLMTFNEDGGQD